jgi:tetratricopeptide (TPR) repeat protein
MRRVILTVFFVVLSFTTQVFAQEKHPIRLYLQSHDNLQDETDEFIENLQSELAEDNFTIEIVTENTNANLEITFDIDEDDNIIFRLQPITPLELPNSPALYAHFNQPFTYTIIDWNRDLEALLHLSSGIAFYSVEEWYLASDELIGATYDVRIETPEQGIFLSIYLGNCYVANSEYERATHVYFASIIGKQFLPLYVNSIWTLLQLDTDWTSRYGQNQAFYLEYNFGVLDNILSFHNPSTSQSIEILYHRAQLYALAFDYDSAIADMDAAIELAEANNVSDEQLAELYTLRGEIIFLIYEWDRVLENFNTALELDPDYAPAYFQRGVLFYTMTEREHALADFQHYLEIAPDGEHAAETQRYLDSIQLELESLGG